MESVTNNYASGSRANRIRVFTLVWFGQLVSTFGSGLSGFAIGVWVFQKTGSVTQYAVLWLCISLPVVLLSPLAGVLVDRSDRRWVMILSDSVAALSTAFLAVLLLRQRLEAWHVYVAVALSAVAGAFQWPAFRAATTLLVPRQHLGRASGAIEFAQAAGQVLSPALAGLLLALIAVEGLILIDLGTFLFAIVMLLVVQFPGIQPHSQVDAPEKSLRNEARYGWNYISTRPGLIGLLIFFAISNFMQGVTLVLFTPLVLSFASAAKLGVLVSIGGAGMLLGSLLMSIWGGSRRRINTVLGFELLSGVFMLIAGLMPAAPLVAFAAFGFLFCTPIINASNNVIWQTKVAPEVQGRVFATRRMIATSSLPLAYLVAGPLADYVFKPLLSEGGKLAGTVGRIIGVGPGRGIGLLFIVMGSFTMLATIVGYCYPPLRLVEKELPDVTA